MSADDPDQRPSPCDHDDEIAELRRQVAAHERALAELRREIATLRSSSRADPSAPPPEPVPVAATSRDPARVPQPELVVSRRSASVTQESSGEAKIALYRSLFDGRADVYARRWENTSKGSSGWSPAHRGSWKTPRDQRQYLPLTDEVVRGHLEGRDTVGLYPLLVGDTCRLLACDFDKSSWKLDAQAYVEAAEAADVPSAVEISRSGNGAHVWTFFTLMMATQGSSSSAADFRATCGRRTATRTGDVSGIASRSGLPQAVGEQDPVGAAGLDLVLPGPQPIEGGRRGGRGGHACTPKSEPLDVTMASPCDTAGPRAAM